MDTEEFNVVRALERKAELDALKIKISKLEEQVAILSAEVIELKHILGASTIQYVQRDS